MNFIIDKNKSQMNSPYFCMKLSFQPHMPTITKKNNYKKQSGLVTIEIDCLHNENTLGN